LRDATASSSGINTYHLLPRRPNPGFPIEVINPERGPAISILKGAQK
jgi:hypothetical protein